MTKITRKLLLSIITVVLTVVALGTTTFAWFTLTNTATVQEFEAEIIADSGIEIAIGALNTADLNTLEWKTVITPDDMYSYFGGAGATSADMPLLNHVTSPDGINFLTLGTTSQPQTTTAGYIEIPIHFRSDSANAIEWASGFISGSAASWTVDTAFTDASGTARTVGSTMNVNPADAIRIAIQGTVDSDPSHVVAFENPAAGTNVVLGTGGNFGTNDYSGGGQVPVVNTETASNPSAYANGSYDYFLKKNVNLPLWGIEDVTTVATDTTINNQTLVELVTGHLGTTGLAQTYYGNITIRIWIEGWDANSFDAQLARTISVSLGFFGVDA